MNSSVVAGVPGAVICPPKCAPNSCRLACPWRDVSRLPQSHVPTHPIAPSPPGLLPPFTSRPSPPTFPSSFSRTDRLRGPIRTRPFSCAQHKTLLAEPVDSSRYATVVRLHCNSSCHLRFTTASAQSQKYRSRSCEGFRFMPRQGLGLHCAHPLFHMQVSHSHTRKPCATPRVFLLRQITIHVCV